MLTKRLLRKYGKLDAKTEERLKHIYLNSRSFRISCKAHRRLCEHWGIDYNHVRNDR